MTDSKTSAYLLLQRWGGELVADLVSAEVLGAAPILALISLEYCGYPQMYVHIAGSHPATRWRLAVVSRYLNRKYGHDWLQAESAAYENAWKYSASAASKDTDELERTVALDELLFQKIVEPLARAIEQEVAALGLPKHTVTSDGVARCLARLRQGMPIGAQGAGKKELTAQLEVYRSKSFSSAADRRASFAELTQSFMEQPLDMATILLSSHLRRLEVISEALDADLPFETIDISERFVNALGKLDEVTWSSLRTSMVHRKLIESQSADG